MNEIETIKNTIHKNYHLQRDCKHWKLNDQPTVKLRAPNPHSIGFSLDNQTPSPLAFFSNKPPKYLAKMADAILALKYKRKVYWFVIEQKTATKNDYKKQLINGKLFCDWLIALYKQYNYLPNGPICISLLVWKPRERSINKGATTHYNKPSKTINVGTFDYSFEVQNVLDISLADIIQAV